ncbi:MAG: hypothetical protein ABI565_06920 [Vicinamibacteria bacterium]
MNILAAALVALSAYSFLPSVFVETDLTEAKALFFDRKYEESRSKWTEIAVSKGPSAEAATYWIARCSESLGESERAFREYGAFLDLPPTDARLAEEAEISRIGLATKLTRGGKPGFLTAVIRSLGDDRPPVRYFGALQAGSLPNLSDARKATPVLREIVTTSKDPDLVERAKLQLFRIEPRSISETPPVRSARPPPTPSGAIKKLTPDPGPQGAARLLRIRISKAGKQTVAVTVPFSLAEFVFGSLPEATKKSLQLKGYDAEGFWKRLRTLNIREIVSIVGEDGETIEVWVE